MESTKQAFPNRTKEKTAPQKELVCGPGEAKKKQKNKTKQSPAFSLHTHNECPRGAAHTAWRPTLWRCPTAFIPKISSCTVFVHTKQMWILSSEKMSFCHFQTVQCWPGSSQKVHKTFELCFFWKEIGHKLTRLVSSHWNCYIQEFQAGWMIVLREKLKQNRLGSAKHMWC